MLKPGSFPFVWVILACGAVALGFIAWNLATFGLHRYPADTRLYVAGASPVAGRKAIERFGCGGCHAIPGVQNATGRVGPRLSDIDRQTYIAGHLPNTPDNLVTWIQSPQHLSPSNAMPDLGVSRQEAMDMAAYLYGDES